MTGRDVPFDPSTPCDNCGVLGAFDFMGDYLCVRCSGKPLWEIEEMSQYGVQYRDLDTLVAVSIHPDGTFSLGGYQDNIPARFINRLQSLRELARQHCGTDWGRV